MLICANKSTGSCRIQLQRFCQSHVNHWYRLRRVKGVLLWSTTQSYLPLQHCCISCRRKTSAKIPTVGMPWKPWMSSLKEIQRWKIRDLPQHVTEELVTWEQEVKCAGGCGCERANSRNSAQREKPGMEKTRHFHRKTDGQPTLCVELGRIFSSYISTRFLFKTQFYKTANKLRPTS